MAKTDAEIDSALAALAASRSLGKTRRYNDQEAQVLDLYEQLNALKLEQAVIRAETESRPAEHAQTVGQARRDLLEARALHSLKQSVVEDVLQSEPIIQAVGVPTSADPLERELEYMISCRDSLAMVHESLNTALHGVLDDLTLRQVDNFSALRKNRELAAELLEIAERTKQDRLEGLDNPQLEAELEAARSEAKENRQRYRIIKGLTSGVIVGSGVNWAADEHLRNLVLDSEE